MSLYQEMLDGFVCLILNVDNILIAGKFKEHLSSLTKKMSLTFEVKNLGDERYILGMRIIHDRSKGCILVSVRVHIIVLHWFNTQTIKELSTPLPAYVRLSTNDTPKFDYEKGIHDQDSLSVCCW